MTEIPAPAVSCIRALRGEPQRRSGSPIQTRRSSPRRKGNLSMRGPRLGILLAGTAVAAVLAVSPTLGFAAADSDKAVESLVPVPDTSLVPPPTASDVKPATTGTIPAA